MTILDFLITLASRKRTIFAIAGGSTAIAIVVSLLLPSRYTAQVTLLPPQQTSSMASNILSQLGGAGLASIGGNLGMLKNPNEMYVAMLKSRTVEDAMVQRYNLMAEYHQKYLSNARREFENQVKVDGSGKDGLIHILVEDRDPNHAAQLANGYVDQFRQLSEHLAISEASQRRKFFEQQLQQAKENLANAEDALKAMEQKTGVIALDSQARALIESAASLRAQVAAKQTQIQGMRLYATNQNADIVRAEQELHSLEAQLASLGGSDQQGETSLIVPQGKVPQAGMEYMRRLRDVKYNETIFEILARQFEAAKLDEAREGALIQVVDAAIPPDRRSFPKRTLIAVGGAIFGFFAGIFYVLFRTAYEQMREDPETGPQLRLLLHAISWRRRPRISA